LAGALHRPGTAQPVTESWHGREAELRRAGEPVFRDWEDGWAAGDPERANTFVGEAIGLIHTIDPAGAVVERIAAQAAALLARS
jgi:nitronate monooxygenase